MTDEAGQPIAWALVQCYDQGGEIRTIDFTDAGGRFEHELLRAGTYFVVAPPSEGHLGALFDALPCAFQQPDVTPLVLDECRACAPQGRIGP